jgi:hypothetical protein
MFARVSVLIGSLLLAACAALNVVHDPQSGLITRSQVPKLLQSVRCELVTFYTVNRWRYAQFHLTKNYATAVKNYSYFPLAEDELSAVFLDLKVIDNIGIPSGSAATTVNQTILSNGGVDKRTWHLGPSISDTNTYELNWPFVVAQNSTLDLSHHEGDRQKPESANNFFPCYHNLPANPNLEGLARHQFPEMENFARIYIDGTESLAGWMLDSSAELGTAYFEKNQKATEIMYPAQMLYTFTVQFGFGADASLSLITAKWNPVGLDIAGSTQQTSMLTLYINGKDSINAYAAKVGLAGAVPQSGRSLLPETPCGPPECSGARPTYTIGIPIPQPQQ